MNIHTYDIFVNLDVKHQFINSRVCLTFNINEKQVDELMFYIHKDFNIKSITCDFMGSFEIGQSIAQWSPFILESKYIKVFLRDKISQAKTITLNFEYEGHLDLVTQYGINRITDYWVELGFYTPWFPLTQGFNSSLFNVDLEIDPGYIVVGGKKKISQTNTWLIKNDKPQTDCVILASNQFKSINDEIKVYYLDENHTSLAKMLAQKAKDILGFYERIFGKTNSSIPSVVIIPREEGGGYCRDGLIVVAGTNNLKADLNTFKFIAHELAHLWWFKADFNTWEDWLNESFAEYSALMMVKEEYGINEFNSLMGLYKQRGDNLPPINNLDRKDAKAYEVLYIKGPILLHKLENYIGEVYFKDLLKNSHQNNINKTQEFLDLLKEQISENIAEKFLIWLSS